jgi:hypothetical protein
MQEAVQMQDFDNDDPGYLTLWEHGDAPENVVNREHDLKAGNYMVRHRGTCGHIKPKATDTWKWTHSYGKTCGSAESIMAWAATMTGVEVRDCQRCRP